MKKIIAVTALAMLLACAPSANHAAAPSPARSAELLYVCNQSDATVTLIDTKTNTIVRTIDLKALGFTPNAKPHHIQVEPDGSFWYVTLIGENKIVKIDANDHVVGQATFETPGMMALDPSNDLLYVGRSMTAVNPPKRVGVIHRSNMSIDEVDVLFPRPHAMAVDARDHTVYTGSLAVNQLAAIDENTERVELVDVAGNPHSLMQYALSPDGTTLVASGELSHSLLVFDVSDRMKPKWLRTFDVETQPFDPVWTRDGKFVVLGNKAANAITVVNMRTNDVKVIHDPGIRQPHGSAVSVDGRWVYISNNNLTSPSGAHPMQHDMSTPMPPAQPAGPGTIVVLDAHTWQVAKVIEVGHNASGIAVRSVRP